MNAAVVIPLSNILLVAAGGAIGCVARYLSIAQISRLNPSAFPLGTLLVNILGSLLIGVIMAKYGAQQSARLFLVTGILGGFTTFSAFSWDVLQLLQRGQHGWAIAYIGGSVAISLLAVVLGYQLGK